MLKTFLQFNNGVECNSTLNKTQKRFFNNKRVHFFLKKMYPSISQLKKKDNTSY